jgi:hypothetical protein
MTRGKRFRESVCQSRVVWLNGNAGHDDAWYRGHAGAHAILDHSPHPVHCLYDGTAPVSAVPEALQGTWTAPPVGGCSVHAAWLHEDQCRCGGRETRSNPAAASAAAVAGVPAGLPASRAGAGAARGEPVSEGRHGAVTARVVLLPWSVGIDRTVAVSAAAVAGVLADLLVGWTGGVAARAVRFCSARAGRTSGPGWHQSSGRRDRNCAG